MAVSIQRVQSKRVTTWPLPMVIAWLIWRRHRIAFGTIAVGLFIWTVLAHTVFAGMLTSIDGFWAAPSSSMSDSGPINSVMIVLVFCTLVVAFICAAACLLFVACMSLGGPSSSIESYPACLLRAPAATVGLAVWPIIFGMVLLASLWVFTDIAIIHPMGVSAPVIGPAVIMALVCALLPAALWPPLSIGLKLIFMIFFGVAFMSVAMAWRHEPWVLTYPACAAAWTITILCAIVGLEKDRCGQTYKLWWPTALRRLTVLFERPTVRFASAVEAQRRLEWVWDAGSLPRIALFFATFTLPFLLVRSTIPLGFGLGAFAKLQSIHGSYFPVVIGIFTFTLPLISQPKSVVAAHNNYLLTRPMSTQALVAARLHSALLSTTMAIAIFFIWLGVWLLSPAQDGQSHATLGVLLWRHGGMGLATAWLCYVALWTAMVYRLCIDGYSMSLSGSTSFVGLNMFFAFLAVFILSRYLAGGNFIDFTTLVLPFWVYLLVAFRALIGLYVLGIVARRRLVDIAGLARAGGVWIVVTACLYALVLTLLPKGTVSPTVLAVGVFFVMPCIRLSLGPLLLDRNRHR